jgi:predicted PurR-regulated permease PerM
MNSSAHKWSASTKRAVALALLVLLALIVYRFRAVLPPLILAFLLAFILDPLVDLAETRTRLSRTAATALVFVLLLVLLVAAPVVATPPLVRAVRSLDLDFRSIATNLDDLAARPVAPGCCRKVSTTDSM